MSTKILLTADELERMPDDDSVQIELDEGQLITMPPAGEEHGHVELGIGSGLLVFVRKHDLGRVSFARRGSTHNLGRACSNTGFRLSQDTVRVPDLAFVRKKRVAAIHSEGFLRGAPDLAIEIFSWSDSPRQLTRKEDQYLAAGCEMVWVVHPARKGAYVFYANGADRELGPEDMLDAPKLLPGFSLKVSELFK